MTDHDDLIERLEKLRTRIATGGPPQATDPNTLAEVIDLLSGERITLWRGLDPLGNPYEGLAFDGGWHIARDAKAAATFRANPKYYEVRVAALLPEGEGE